MSPSTLALLVVFFASGFAGLVYEVLWMHRLGLVFGQTAYAAAMTLAVFFAGISAGSLLWGERAARSARPLRLYALLEVGIGIASGASFFLFTVYNAWFPSLFARFHSAPALFFMMQCGLAVVALFPPALCMGGTLPAMGQHLVRRTDELGRTASLLYAINTIGGAFGAFVAGFYLPPLLGFTNAYFLTVALSIGLGVAAYALSLPAPVSVTADGHGPDTRAAPASRSATPAKAAGHTRASSGEDALDPVAILGLAALSGFVALGLEVLWTRMFALVLHNSVYSFAVILVTFLLALALGSALAHALVRRAVAPVPALCVLLLAAGLAAGTSPYAFWWMTDGLAYVAPQQAWGRYIRSVFATAAGVMLVPGVLLGAVFPYLHRLAQRIATPAGAVVGRLAAANTVGGIAGALVAGFVLLGGLGLWASVRTLALFYLLAAWFVAKRCGRARAGLRAVAAVGVVLLVTIADPARLSILRVDPKGRESVYETWESPHGVVSVVRVGNNLRIRVDNYYALGGTGARRYEETQADIPLLIHPQPRTVFFLGLGTGITAGAALRHPVEQVTAAELIPAVAEAARKYFGPYTNGLFSDPRARVVIADGRSYLLGTPDRYDVIISDLFVPWQAGAGSLYTREQFEIVRRRLAPGGVFAQWLPLYQLSREETFTIIRTMMDVFPQVTMWRGDFLPEQPIIALVGEPTERPLDVDGLIDNFRRRRQRADVPRDHVLGLMGLFYLGNLGANRDLFQPYPINTDDRPLIEYSSPITQREERAHAGLWFTSLDLAAWQTELATRTPPAQDPYLRTLSAHEQDFMRAGLYLFRARVYGSAGRAAEAKAAAEEFRRLVPVETAQMFEQQLEEWQKASSPRSRGRRDDQP